MRLTLIRGISGSGKSTRARELADATGAKIVSRDDIRFGLFGVEFDPEIENDVSVIEKSMIEGYLKAGYDVISDNTYIDMKYVNAMAKFAYRLGADFDVVVIDVPLAEAKMRNDHRAMLGGRHVPHDVIARQYIRFNNTKNEQHVQFPELIPYSGTPGKPKAFLFDLDGTVYHMNDKRGPYDHNVDVDDPDLVVQDVVRCLSYHMFPIAMSGRKTITRATTIGALNRDDVPFYQLLMRADGDDRADNIIKHELFNNYVRDNFDVQFVLDDRDQVVNMWRRMGLKCLQVQEGDF